MAKLEIYNPDGNLNVNLASYTVRMMGKITIPAGSSTITMNLSWSIPSGAVLWYIIDYSTNFLNTGGYPRMSMSGNVLTISPRFSSDEWSEITCYIGYYT